MITKNVETVAAFGSATITHDGRDDKTTIRIQNFGVLGTASNIRSPLASPLSAQNPTTFSEARFERTQLRDLVRSLGDLLQELEGPRLA